MIMSTCRVKVGARVWCIVSVNVKVHVQVLAIVKVMVMMYS